MATSLCSAGDIDRGYIASLLARLIVDLDAAPRGNDLRPLVRTCKAALEAALDATRAAECEPSRPTGRELARLAELLLTAESTAIAGVMRQIRRSLGRLDARGDS